MLVRADYLLKKAEHEEKNKSLSIFLQFYAHKYVGLGYMLN